MLISPPHEPANQNAPFIIIRSDDSPLFIMSSDIPSPKTFEELVKVLNEQMGQDGLDSCSDVSRIQQILANYKSNPVEWEKYAMFDSGRYTRNLVDNGNGKFNLMILCWDTNQCR